MYSSVGKVSVLADDQHQVQLTPTYLSSTPLGDSKIMEAATGIRVLSLQKIADTENDVKDNLDLHLLDFIKALAADQSGFFFGINGEDLLANHADLLLGHFGFYYSPNIERAMDRFVSGEATDSDRKNLLSRCSYYRFHDGEFAELLQKISSQHEELFSMQSFLAAVAAIEDAYPSSDGFTLHISYDPGSSPITGGTPSKPRSKKSTSTGVSQDGHANQLF